MPKTSADKPGEVRTSLRVDQRKDEIVLVREFQAFGSVGEVWGRKNENVALPFIGQKLERSIPLDPNPTLNFVDLLSGLRDAGHPGPEWGERLYCGEISVESDDKDPTVHKVTAVYSTFFPQDPRGPAVQINVGTETLTLEWDWHGNPITPGADGGIPVEVPIVHLSYSVPMDKFSQLFDEIAGQVGKTNNNHWRLFSPAASTPHSDNRNQWVFLGADAVQSGVLNWKPTFRFIWYPPIAIQNWFVREEKNGPVTQQTVLIERGRYFYWFIKRADGSINQTPKTDSTVPGSEPGLGPESDLHGLQWTVIRDAFDFNPFFTSEGVDPGANV